LIWISGHARNQTHRCKVVQTENDERFKDVAWKNVPDDPPQCLCAGLRWPQGAIPAQRGRQQISEPEDRAGVRDDNPPTREQGTDKPGRAFASVGARRSAMEEADIHEIEEQRFAKSLAAKLEVLVREKNILALVIAAPRARWPNCANR
jgi:hypothetical protein